MRFVCLYWLFGAILFSTTFAFAQQSPRRYALLVGVGSYQNPNITPLAGPPNDVDLLAQILTDANGYGFRKEDVVTLRNEAATVSAVRGAMQSHLIAKAKPEDVVLFYFSGHGSQIVDRNGDEVDGMDETLILHDSRTPGQCDWVDDDLNQLLGQIKAEHLVVILDACHSGTGTRGNGAVEKKINPSECPPAATVADAMQTEAPAPMASRIEMMAVADDGKLAFVEGNYSVFTQALAEVLSQNLSQGLTYRQLEARVRHKMVGKDQIPFFGVPEDQKIFNTDRSQRPFTYLVTDVKSPIVIAKGLPMPGWSEGGQVLVYAADAGDDMLKDPQQSKTVLNIQKAAQGTLYLAPVKEPLPKTLAVGDLLVLEKPGDAASKLRLHLRPASKAGGLPAAMAAELTEALQSDTNLAHSLDLGATPWDWEIALDATGKRLEFNDSEGRARNSLALEEGYAGRMAELVRLFALQQYLMTYSQPDVSPSAACRLKIDLVKTGSADQTISPPPGKTILMLADKTQFEIKVTHACKAGCAPLHVGVMVLSSDGSIYAWPEAGKNLMLEPGREWISEGANEAGPPYGISDFILAVGSGEGDPVAWHRFTSDASKLDGTRTRGDDDTAMFRTVASQTHTSRMVKARKGWVSTLAVLQVHE